MPIQMTVDKEKIKVLPPPDAGLKVLRLVSFKPKRNKNKDGINFNPMFEVENCPPDRNKAVFNSMSDKFHQALLDICHGLGFDMDPTTGALPGGFEGDANEPSTWQYKGPLMGKTMEAECEIDTYLGKDSLKIKSIRCKVSGCKEKHSTNLNSKK